MVSVIIPVFNEEKSVEELTARVTDQLRGVFDYEIIFVDDGSADDTLRFLKRLRFANNKIKIICFRRNFGKSAALSAGFTEARGDLIITMDGDLQDDPTEIPNFIAKINQGYDLVSGWKKKRHDPLIKKISSKVFNLTVSKLMKLKLHDFNCGFKIYRREVIRSIEVYGELHRFLPAIAHQKGFRVGEIPVRHHARQFGKSKYGGSGLRRAKNYLLDPINVVLITKYIQKPIHFFGTIGLLVFSIGFVINAYLVGQKIITGSLGGHYPLLMFGILLIMVGVQLVSLGLLAEMITQANRKKEDVYSIREKIL